MIREMKDSGVPWIGKIPVNWKTIRLKYISKLINGFAFKSQDLKADGHYKVVRIGDLNNNKINLEDCLGVDSIDNYRDYKIYMGDVLVALSGATVGKVAFADNNIECYINQRVGIIRSLWGRLIFHIFSLDKFIENLKSCLNDSAQPNLSIEDIGRISIPIYDKNTIKRIVRYLDIKCAQIDTIIAKEQSVIEKLQEYKRAIITNAVVKGLDLTVEMADSGIEWIDSIPNHWKINRLIFSAYIRARLGWKGLKADEYTSEGHPFLSAVNIQNDKLVWEDLNFINDNRYDESPEIKLELGDLLLVKDGAGIGKCAIVDQLPYGTATTNSSLGVITPYSELNSMYLYYFFESAIFQNYISRIKNGMGVPHLTQGNLKNIMVVIPSYCEQEAIVAYLDDKCSNLDSIILKKQALIDKLTEYKKSLIYEVVTGKKEVPHV